MATPEERSQSARIAALVRHSRGDASEATAAARLAAASRFYDLVDPDEVLSPEERERRADAARRAHFARMGLRSAQARRKRAEAKGNH